MSNRSKFLLLFLFLFVFRTLFGLSLTFFGANDIENDALQTYLIGLKFYTTGDWPFFGPDQYLMDRDFFSQIPGALEGIVIGLPFQILPIPEAPFLVLNLLSLSALALLAWALSKRLPELSFAFIFAWLALLPWTLNRSTHVFNVSYLLFGSALFFVGFLEALPELSKKKISPRLAFALMGFGLFWDMQFHNSWVLLPPFLLGAFLQRRRKNLKGWGSEINGVLTGAVLPLALLAPTLAGYGLLRETAGLTAVSMGFNWENFKFLPTILARYLSFPCFEMPRFIGSGTAERTQFFKDAFWLIPPGIFLTLLGWVQPVVLLVWGWFKDRRHREGRLVQGLVMTGLLWTWFCFWFTSNGPAAHMYYVLFPLTAVGFFYACARLAPKLFWRRFGLVCLLASLWFQTGYLVKSMKGPSLFSDRARIVRAIDQRDHRFLAERRARSFY